MNMFWYKSRFLSHNESVLLVYALSCSQCSRIDNLHFKKHATFKEIKKEYEKSRYRTDEKTECNNNNNEI